MLYIYMINNGMKVIFGLLEYTLLARSLFRVLYSRIRYFNKIYVMKFVDSQLYSRIHCIHLSYSYTQYVFKDTTVVSFEV